MCCQLRIDETIDLPGFFKNLSIDSNCDSNGVPISRREFTVLKRRETSLGFQETFSGLSDIVDTSLQPEIKIYLLSEFSSGWRNFFFERKSSAFSYFRLDGEFRLRF